MEGLAAGNIEGATARHEDEYEGSDNLIGENIEGLAAGNIEGATARQDEYERFIDNLIGENENFLDEYEYEGSDNLIIEVATSRQDESIDNLIGENEKVQEFTKDYDTSDISLPAPTAVSQDAQPFDSSLSRPVVIQKRGMFQYSVFRKLIKSR